MCGIAGSLSFEGVEAASLAYEELFFLQHRGDEATGIASIQADGNIVEHRRQGNVGNSYSPADLARLSGSSAIGMVRYSTSGSKEGHPQPYVDEESGFALTQNGNTPTTQAMEEYLGSRSILYSHANDTELMGMTVSQHIRDGLELPDAIEQAYPLFTGAFSAAAIHGDTMVAFRDPYGIRPLAIGESESGYTVTSETCALDLLQQKYKREVAPGELVIITSDGIESRQLAEPTEKLDMFEFVYFAKHDSKLYGQRVNEVRRRFGQQLAIEQPPVTDDPDNIIVVPVPDSSIPIAKGYADALGLKDDQAIIKTRNIRSFQQPTDGQRRRAVRRKHSLIPEIVKGKDVIMIDDSIVRLNTVPNLTARLKKAGAKSITVLIGSPPVRFPDYYGIDTPDQSELAAANMTIEEMRSVTPEIKHLAFLSLSGMIEATQLPAEKFNLSCFNGEYPIDIGHHEQSIRPPVSMEFAE